MFGFQLPCNFPFLTFGLKLFFYEWINLIYKGQKQEPSTATKQNKRKGTSRLQATGNCSSGLLQID